MMMTELFKMAIDKPVNAILIVLCVGVLANHVKLSVISVAVAGVEKQQESNEFHNKKVALLDKQLARIDANTRYTKERQDEWIEITKSLVQTKLEK